MDRIEFRLRSHYCESFEMNVEVVAILVNDTPLENLWSAAGGRDSVPMSADELGSGGTHLWGRNPQGDATLIEDGRVAVLNCTCGGFPCGGGTARIAFDADTVTWSEFSEANSRRRIGLGPFEFGRQGVRSRTRTNMRDVP
jgi:hypothetical protein